MNNSCYGAAHLRKTNSPPDTLEVVSGKRVDDNNTQAKIYFQHETIHELQKSPGFSQRTENSVDKLPLLY